MTIDTSLTTENALRSIDKLMNEGYGWSTFRFDTFASSADNTTDILMLQNGMSLGGENFLYNAMNVNNYARYWHGYLIVLKPLLIFTDIQGIRIINMFVFYSLVMYLLIKLKEITESYLFPLSLLIGLIMCYIYIIPISMQYMSVFIITFVCSLLVLNNVGNIKKLYLIFFIVGSFVNFFDFLTAPMVSMGVPIIIYIYLCYNKKTTSNIMKDVIMLSIFWCLGYGFTWISKWIMGTLILNRNIITEGIKQSLFRINGSVEYVLDYRKMFHDNLLTFFGKKEFFYSYIVIVSLSFLILCLKLRKKICNFLPLIFVILYPFIWLVVLGNHSQIHYYMTYRNLLIFFLAMNIFIIEAIKIILLYVKSKKEHIN